MKKLFPLIIFIFCSTTIYAQTALGPIKTDRPDQTESPYTTPRKYWQVEAGVFFESDRRNGATNQEFLLPTTLTKYGINDRFELRLIREIGISNLIAGNRTVRYAGFTPLIVGFKANLIKENRDKFIPQTSFIGHLGLRQLSSDYYTPYRAFPQFRFLMEHTLTSKTILGYNLGMEWDGFSPNPTSIYTLTVARDLGKDFGAFAEIYGFFTRYDVPDIIEGDHRFDGGITYLLNQDVQFDVSAGVGLTPNAPQYFLSAGISFRFK